MKTTNWLIGLFLAAVTLVGTACDNRSNDTVEVNDPEGTVIDTLDVTKDNGRILIDGFAIQYNAMLNSFIGSSQVIFSSYGKTLGLAFMDHMPSTSWYSHIAAVPNYGYVLQLGNNPVIGYARMLPIDYVETEDSIIGIVVKYQYPWEVEHAGPYFAENTDNPVGPDPVDPQQEELRLSESQITLKVDEHGQLTPNRTVDSWSVDDENIIEFIFSNEEYCLFRAKEEGMTQIVARAGNKTARCTVIVNPKNPEPVAPDPIDPDPVEPENFADYWNNSTWHFTGTMVCDGEGEQNFTITFHDVYQKSYTSDLNTKYWLATSLQWEDYGQRRITLRGHEDGHTSFDFDYGNQNTVLCEYHHWDTQGNFCKAYFIGTRVQ